MTEQEKSILVKDLCGRLPYGVAFEYRKCNNCVVAESINVDVEVVNEDYLIKDVKPYLFPMSSMTEEQYKEFNSLTNCVEIDGIKGHYKDYIKPHIGNKWIANSDGNIEPVDTELSDYLICINWLYKHHFDIHGLIEKGLAIDATNLNVY